MPNANKESKAKIYIIAGENSGDFMGGLLIKSLRKEGSQYYDNIEFRGVGGNCMQDAGLKSIFSSEQINLMGFVEVIPHIFRIKKLIKKTVADIIANDPKVLVTIDSPGFTYRVATAVKKLAPHIKLVHIVAPSVWVYKPGRAKKYAKTYNHMLTLLPFEPKYFLNEGLPSTCIGHPVLEQYFYKKSKSLRLEMAIDDEVKVIAVTPGSRKGEISRHMPVIRKVFDRLSMIHNIKVIFVQSDDSNVKLINKFLSKARFNYTVSTDRLKVFAISDCALAKSGTNTLEIVASGTPMVVGYKLNSLTFAMLKMFIKVKYASLINIINKREIIPEYIQSKFNDENITKALSKLLNTPETAKDQVKEGQRALNSIGWGADIKPSESAAKIIINMI